MTDDDLITGAAAPSAERIIRSPIALDAVWVACVSALLIVSSVLPLVDLEEVYLRTADAPLRVYTVWLPVVAVVTAVLGVVRRSSVLGAVATGLLVPSVALAGSVAAALFFDAASPFTDVGVPVTLAAAAIGLIMLLRWFVYQPTPIVGVDLRPNRVSAVVLVALGVALAANVAVSAVSDDDPWSLPFAMSTALMMLTAAVVVAAGFVRSDEANVLAATACAAQLLAVIVVRVVEPSDSGVGLAESATTLRTGAVGLVLLAAAAGVAIFGAAVSRLDPAVADGPDATDDAAWRWSADDA
ncbi:hypothetical protein [Ilumatobacter nonamiensis]|uniref:hypothetical protein n=1 Tax=Ilumatobacter nonamiensis TaxID=467093 RepID=UPI00034B1C8C|nr:hypothetical protein [Ilumatobacter nonamiensis]